MSLNDVWMQYGLTGNPFFQDPLSPADKEHPLDLMVGRAADLERARRTLTMAGENGRLVVEGGAGVGKTTFVNRLKQLLTKDDGFVTHEPPIRVEAATTPQQFHIEILREILRMRTQVLGADANPKKDSANSESAAFWANLSMRIEGRITRSFTGTAGVTVAGVGVSGTRAERRDGPDVDTGSLHREVTDAIGRARKELKRRLLFHVNNFENLTLKGHDSASDLLLQVRDDLMVKGAHWIFVGPADMTARIFRRRPQVGGIIPEPIQLAPLTPAQVTELLDRRYRHLKPGLKQVAPVAPEDAAELYESYLGDLRNFLRLLSDASTRLLGLTGVKPMSLDSIRGAMQPAYREELEGQLSATIREHWHTILREGAEEGPFTATRFRATDVAGYIKKSGPSVENAITALLEARLVSIGERDGRSQWYGVTGPALIAYGMHAAVAKPARRKKTQS